MKFSFALCLLSVFLLFTSCEDLFQEVPYKIEIDDSVKGRISTDATTATPVALVTVKVEPGNTPERLYYFQTSYPDRIEDISLETLTFSMPAKNITITANF
ncbi:MAG: hypothetical protein ACRC4W_06755 [Treponemataceae bacterium]